MRGLGDQGLIDRVSIDWVPKHDDQKAQDFIERRRIAMNSSRALRIALHIDGG